MGLGANLTLTPAYSGAYFKQAYSNTQVRIEELLNGQNSLNNDTKTENDKIKDDINALIETENVNIEEVNNKLQILADIFSKDGTANDVFDSLVLMANAWNNAGDISQTMEGIFNSETGELNIDISSFNFNSKDDYSIVGSTDSLGALNVALGFNKLDEKTVVVTAFNRACFVEDSVPYNASAEENNFNITFTISYKRPHLSFKLTDEQSTTTEVI